MKSDFDEIYFDQISRLALAYFKFEINKFNKMRESGVQMKSSETQQQSLETEESDNKQNQSVDSSQNETSGPEIIVIDSDDEDVPPDSHLKNGPEDETQNKPTSDAPPAAPNDTNSTECSHIQIDEPHSTVKTESVPENAVEVADNEKIPTVLSADRGNNLPNETVNTNAALISVPVPSKVMGAKGYRFICNVRFCNYSAKYKNHLRKHMLTHIDQKCVTCMQQVWHGNIPWHSDKVWQANKFVDSKSLGH